MSFWKEDMCGLLVKETQAPFWRVVTVKDLKLLKVNQGHIAESKNKTEDWRFKVWGQNPEQLSGVQWGQANTVRVGRTSGAGPTLLGVGRPNSVSLKVSRDYL